MLACLRFTAETMGRSPVKGEREDGPNAIRRLAPRSTTSPVGYPSRVMFETAMKWTAEWTVGLPLGIEDSRAGLLSSLLSVSWSKRMVLDGRNRRNRLTAGRAKSFESS